MKHHFKRSSLRAFLRASIPATFAVALLIPIGAAPVAAATPPVFKPPFVCGTTYEGIDYAGHEPYAVDFNQPNQGDDGDPVLASLGGTVNAYTASVGYVKIAHPNGWETVYRHMSNITVNLTDKKTVTTGQQIGRISDLGEASGPHLHYEQRYGGAHVQVTFNRNAYHYNTNIKSDNCGSPSPTDPEGAAMFKDLGTQMSVYRWSSNGSGFENIATADTGAWDVAGTGSRFAAGDIDGDGDDDLVAADQNANGTFSFHVWKNGITYNGIWYTSGAFNLANVGGRMAVGDFTGDGKAEPAMFYDMGTTMRVWRWTSTGSSFGSGTFADTGTWTASATAGRFAAGDIDGDGDDDLVAAHQYSDNTFVYHTFKNGLTHDGVWYHSGQFNLSNVAARMTVGDFNGDGKAEPAMFYDMGTTMRVWRWTSTGSSFGSGTFSDTGTWSSEGTGNRFDAGDIDGDGDDDLVAAHQYSDGTFVWHAFQNGLTHIGVWHHSGQMDLSKVAGRMTLGNW